MKKEFAQLESELAAYGACDPVKLEEKRRALVLAKEAAIRWTGMLPPWTVIWALLTLLTHTDNYSVLLSHFTRQNAVEAADIRAYLGIDEEYEDLDP